MVRKRTSTSKRNTALPSQMRSMVSVPTTLAPMRIGTPMKETVEVSSPLCMAAMSASLNSGWPAMFWATSGTPVAMIWPMASSGRRAR